MARKVTRKSNKTSHVLNLLTGDPKRSEPAVEPSVDPAFESEPAPEESFAPPIQTTDPALDDAGYAETQEATHPTEPILPEFEPEPAPPARRRASSRKTAAPAASSTMMDLSQALEERISQQIHDSLSAKLAEYEAADAKRVEEERKRAERIAAEAGLSLSPAQEDAPEQAPEPQDASDQPEPVPAQEELPAPKQYTEEDFEIVNVMDTMLDGFQQEFMDKFGMCTCRRCWLDTRALTLSSVPAKYVVLTHDTVDAMMNFYEHRYRGMLMAQLTQSCMKVMQNPHH